MARPIASERPRIEVVLEAARDKFLKNGFGATSIDALALSAGVSKATIYRHFKNKEEILEAVIHNGVAAAPIGIVSEDMAKIPLKKALNRFANGLLTSVSHTDSIAMFRLVISESHRLPHLGQFFFNEITSIAAIPLADYLSQQSKAGTLEVPDTKLAAFQFIGMLKEPLFWPLLMGVDESALVRSRKKVVSSAVTGFIQQYRGKDTK